MLTIKNLTGPSTRASFKAHPERCASSGPCSERRERAGADMSTLGRAVHCAAQRLLPFLALAALLSGCAPPGPRALLEGKKLLEQGRYEPAVEKLKTATELLKTNALAWNYLGLACHHAGRSVEAKTAYQRALQHDRDLTEAHYNLGCLWLEANKLDDARLELTACTLRRPNWVEGWLKLGAVQARLHDLNAAEKSFNNVYGLSPDNPEALNGLGLLRLQRGRPADAVAFFNSALRHRPDYAPALLNLAVVSQQYLRDRQLALQKYQAYLRLQPPPPNLAAVALAARQLEQELNPALRPAPPGDLAETNAPAPPPKTAATNAAANVARNTSPPRPAATNTIPSVPKNTSLPKPPPATNAPKPAATTAAFRPASTGAPPSASAVETARLAAGPVSGPARDRPGAPAGSAVPPAGPGKSGPAPARLAGARYAYLSPAKPAPGNRDEAQRAFDQGLQAHRARQLNEAVQAYRRATQLDPSFYEAFYNLGLADSEAGYLAVALAAYEHALAIRPNEPDARYNFALVLERANYWADAANELDRLLALRPNEARAHLALANLYAEQLRQPAKAREHYLKVLAIDPQIRQAPSIYDWLASHPK